MKFSQFLDESKSSHISDHLNAQITKELHNGVFGSEHRHALKIKTISDNKHYVLTSYELDNEHVFEIIEFDSIALDSISAVSLYMDGTTNKWKVKSEAEQVFKKLITNF